MGGKAKTRVRGLARCAPIASADRGGQAADRSGESDFLEGESRPILHFDRYPGYRPHRENHDDHVQRAGVLYRELPEEVLILAVMHLHREPGYWKSRL